MAKDMQAHTKAKFRSVIAYSKFMFNETVTHSITMSDCRTKSLKFGFGTAFEFVEFDVTAHQQSIRCSTRSGTHLQFEMPKWCQLWKRLRTTVLKKWDVLKPYRESGYLLNATKYEIEKG